MVKVSIIVPVHNSQQWLYDCVESALEQTLEEIEIILVDDCSTDRSREIIADCYEQFPEKIVPLYLEENIRQGGARNRGMDIAKGEYIAFLDSDDTLEPDACLRLYEAAAGADMAGADYYTDYGEESRVVTVDYGEGAMEKGRKAWIISHSGYFWSRIYKAGFLRQFDLKFPENTFYEDAYFNFMTVLYARSIVKAEGKFYHYRQNPQSTVHGRNKPHQYERIAIPSIIMAECKKRGIYEEYKDLIDYKYIAMQMGNIRHTCMGQFDKPDVTQLERIRRAVLAECPDYKSNPYYPSTLWTLRHYLELTVKDPKKAIRAYRNDSWVELQAVVREKLGLK